MDDFDRELLARIAKAERQVMRLGVPAPVKKERKSRTWRIKTLPHQRGLINDTTTKILGLCSGFGGGKTWSAARKAVQLAILNPGCDGIITEPTIPLLVKIMYPELEKALNEAGIKWKFNKQDKIYHCRIAGQMTRIICDSMENYTRLIGVNAAWCVCDEFDTTKPDIAMEAYRKLLGRLRTGNVRQMVIVSTPEGFRAMYQIFISEADDQKRLIKARTTDNHYLPQDYIDTLRAQYPPELIEAYLNGEFVNLTGGAVYRNFSRTLNNCDTVAEDDDTLMIGMDFNVGQMAGAVYVQRIADGVEEMHLVDEFCGLLDTDAMIDAIKERYPDHHARGLIEIFPDSSGKNRKTTNANTSDIAMLEDAGFTVSYNSVNPAVRDRVNDVNGMILNGKGQRRLKVNVARCPKATEALEQQIWDPKTGAPDKTSGVDHMADAIGYPIAFCHPIVRPAANDSIVVNFY
uniref:Phage terminase large subunit n=1 Tax=Edwardsiella phage eiAU TaxID=945083 RepID=E7EKS3_9CAUD|nr:phage terminase large subunit [Edwardsiella phage eiAU]